MKGEGDVGEGSPEFYALKRILQHSGPDRVLREVKCLLRLRWAMSAPLTAGANTPWSGSSRFLCSWTRPFLCSSTLSTTSSRLQACQPRVFVSSAYHQDYFAVLDNDELVRYVRALLDSLAFLVRHVLGAC